MTEERDYKDPEYKRWRQQVRARDGHKCRLCGSRRWLQVHHIKRWSDFPQLRFVVSNGVTLCRTCHDRVSGAEEAYEPLLVTVVTRTTDMLLRILMQMRNGQEEN